MLGDWQTMETAPKDGSRIWAFFPFVRQSYAISWRQNSYDREPSWTLDDGESANQTYDPPRYWRPLPAAPE